MSKHSQNLGGMSTLIGTHIPCQDQLSIATMLLHNKQPQNPSGVQK